MKLKLLIQELHLSEKVKIDMLEKQIGKLKKENELLKGKKLIQEKDEQDSQFLTHSKSKITKTSFQESPERLETCDFHVSTDDNANEERENLDY